MKTVVKLEYLGIVVPAIIQSYVHNSGAVLDHMMDVAKEMGVDPKV